MNKEQIYKVRRELLRELPDPREIVRGSLLDRRIFHRQGCLKCRRGEGHRVLVLAVTYPGGRTRQFTIRAEQKAQVQRWLRNYRKLRATRKRFASLIMNCYGGPLGYFCFHQLIGKLLECKESREVTARACRTGWALFPR